ncbi:ABC transporter permease [Marinagarivorans algicola]|uniref:ABC transporter permease n=1 Tax=Marinagarivorans algicola TaxID=1513270 RepID=UPI0006B48447|nr:DUF3526 domain-containing protein [Marinagarivorans algicola]
MKEIVYIAVGELRYWLRSHLALGGSLVFLMLISITSILTTGHINAENNARVQQQKNAEDTFLTQPDRHPHRMVHYGHYVFRSPPPLATFDPGLDAITGQSIFLEGHRQNTAMFAESGASADLGGLSWLSPALVYQIFAPLIIILLGHGAIAREREAALLTPILSLGVSGYSLVLGKALALLIFIIIIMIPLMVTCTIAVFKGADPIAAGLLFCVYLLYLIVWGIMTLCVSSILHKRSTVLAVLSSCWFIFNLALPSLAVNFVTYTTPLSGKIETDLTLLADLHKVGDGHNINDPAFGQLREQLLKKYNAQSLADLPVNFRGIVAIEGERKLTNVLNSYAARRMAGETQQSQQLANYGWLTPTLAITFISRSIAGTDLANYHRFQKEAEALRFSFVQKLNHAHAEQLSYSDDIQRNKDEASGLKARINASNWKSLGSYHFKKSILSDRVKSAFYSFNILLTWFFEMCIMLFLCARGINS